MSCREVNSFHCNELPRIIKNTAADRVSLIYSKAVRDGGWWSHSFSGTVYLTFKNSLPDREDLDYTKIPFQSGEVVCTNGWTRYSFPFSKGSYCGREDKLMKKINTINENLRDGEAPFCDGLYFTFDGHACGNSNGRMLALDLDEDEINQAYYRALIREFILPKPLKSCCENLAHHAKLLALPILALSLVAFYQSANIISANESR